MKLKDKALLILSLSFVFILIFLPPILQNKCISKIEQKQVRGNSLSPLINDGNEIKAFYGYYDCHSIKRGDIVLVKYLGNEYPLIKIVKAVPNDSFHLQKAENGWQILVNGMVLKNFEGRPYLLNKQKKRMLSLYENDYQGIIPEGAYLVLGNISSGSVDSTKFGLVGKSAIIAKVKFKRQFSNLLDSYLNSFYNIFK